MKCAMHSLHECGGLFNRRSWLPSQLKSAFSSVFHSRSQLDFWLHTAGFAPCIIFGAILSGMVSSSKRKGTERSEVLEHFPMSKHLTWFFSEMSGCESPPKPCPQ
jgi:hypothetical protein